MTKVKYKIFSSALFQFFEGFNFSEKSRAAKKRNQILYATWWSTYSQGFSASIFPDRGRTCVSDIYHCYIHYFSLLSKEHKNLIFNGTVIVLLLTIYSLFFCVQRVQRILETQTKYNLKYTSIDNAMLQEFSLLSRENKILSNRNKNQDLKYTFSYNICFAIFLFSPENTRDNVVGATKTKTGSQSSTTHTIRSSKIHLSSSTLQTRLPTQALKTSILL